MESPIVAAFHHTREKAIRIPLPRGRGSVKPGITFLSRARQQAGDLLSIPPERGSAGSIASQIFERVF
jgi:hypothetical protein